MFDYKKSKDKGIKVYAQAEKVVAKATPKCKFHKEHKRHCVDCEKV